MSRSGAIVTALLVLACDGRREEAVRPSAPQLAPPLYSSAPISGTVVDRNTGSPVEGAVVTAIWRKVDNRVGSWNGIFLVRETRTDAAGAFTIPRWGPRTRPASAFLDRRDPELWVLREGYVVGYFDNDGVSDVLLPIDASAGLAWVKLPPNKIPGARLRDYARAEDGSSAWNGRKLAIRRAGDARELARSLGGANPRDPYLPQNVNPPLPLFFGAWSASYATLPEAERAALPDPPLSLIDYTVRAPASPNGGGNVLP